MCQVLSSDVVIGNFILDSIKEQAKKKLEKATLRDLIPLDIFMLIDFDKKLSEKLYLLDYYTKFDVNKLLEFQYNYPFIVEKINETNLFIKTNGTLDNLIKQLERYFRMGMPSSIVTQMMAAYQETLE